MRDTAQRGACCCHPCQPSPCHQLWPLGKPAALSTCLKSYLYPAQLRRGSAFLCSLPRAVRGVRAAGSSAGASGQSTERLPCLVWGDHHGDMKQASQWHGATTHPAATQSWIPVVPRDPFRVPGDPWQCREPTWHQSLYISIQLQAHGNATITS